MLLHVTASKQIIKITWVGHKTHSSKHITKSSIWGHSVCKRGCLPSSTRFLFWQIKLTVVSKVIHWAMWCLCDTLEQGRAIQRWSLTLHHSRCKVIQQVKNFMTSEVHFSTTTAIKKRNKRRYFRCKVFAEAWMSYAFFWNTILCQSVFGARCFAKIWSRMRQRPNPEEGYLKRTINGSPTIRGSQLIKQFWEAAMRNCVTVSKCVHYTYTVYWTLPFPRPQTLTEMYRTTNLCALLYLMFWQAC